MTTYRAMDDNGSHSTTAYEGNDEQHDIKGENIMSPLPPSNGSGNRSRNNEEEDTLDVQSHTSAASNVVRGRHGVLLASEEATNDDGDIYRIEQDTGDVYDEYNNGDDDGTKKNDATLCPRRSINAPHSRGLRFVR